MSQKRRDEMLNLKLEKNSVTVVGDKFFTPRYIGEIVDGKLNVKLTDNYHVSSKSLGIDRIAVESSEVKYNDIEFEYNDERYITTRWFFYAHCKSYSTLQRDVDLISLRTDLFGWKRAIDWEKYIDHWEIAQMDIFDVNKAAGYKDDNNRILRKWEKAMKLVEEYETHNYKKVDL